MLYIEDKSDGSSPFCLWTVIKKSARYVSSSPAAITSVLICFLFLIAGKISWKYVEIWLGLVYMYFDFWPSIKFFNHFSVAANFVHFFVLFGLVRTDIFVCVAILVTERKHLGILVEEVGLPVQQACNLIGYIRAGLYVHIYPYKIKCSF